MTGQASCASCGGPIGLGTGTTYCSTRCRSAGERERRRDPNPVVEQWPNGLARSHAEPRCGQRGSPLRVPVIETHLDEHLRPAYVVWCSCVNDHVSPAFVNIDDAKIAAWDHSFSVWVSDLRVDREEISSNGHKEYAV